MTPTLTALSGLGALVAALLAGGVLSFLLGVWKARPEKDALVISASQGAAEILNSVISAQRGEIERLTARVKELEELERRGNPTP